MDADLINIIYVSAAASSSSKHHPFSKEELIELLNSSRERNKARDITGMLLYCDGQFIQILEGPRESVKQLYNRILSDPRHTMVLKLFEQPIQERCFPDWSMGFHAYTPDELNQIDGYQSLREVFSNGVSSTKHAKVVTSLLQTFKKQCVVNSTK